MTRRALLAAFVVATLTLVFLGSNTIAEGMSSGGMPGEDRIVDMTSWLIPNALVLGVAAMLGWALFGKRH
jgi:hypothetical protein